MKFECYDLKEITLKYEWLGNVRYITVPITGVFDHRCLGPRASTGEIISAKKIAEKVHKWASEAIA